VKTSGLNVRIDPKLKEGAQKAARLDQRTLQSLVAGLLTEYCERVGTLKGRR
jgi:predicted HicB family RNase H-like nuclease